MKREEGPGEAIHLGKDSFRLTHQVVEPRVESACVSPVESASLNKPLVFKYHPPKTILFCFFSHRSRAQNEKPLLAALKNEGRDGGGLVGCWWFVVGGLGGLVGGWGFGGLGGGGQNG